MEISAYLDKIFYECLRKQIVVDFLTVEEALIDFELTNSFRFIKFRHRCRNKR